MTSSTSPNAASTADATTRAAGPAPAVDANHATGLDELTTQIGEAIGPTFDRTPWHGWAMLLGAILAGVIAARIVRVTLDGIAGRLRRRGQVAAGLIVSATARPASLAVFAALFAIGLQGLFVGPIVEGVVRRVIALLWVVAVAWFLVGLVALAEIGLRHVIARGDARVQNQVVPLIGRALRIFVAVVFALFVAENIFGADITAWLAGLGIAGLAVSLAAQDSVKNVFGSLTVLLDRPFAVGDRIVFDGVDGTVESIGLRSTKIRTGHGHLITMPNMKFTDGKVENISERGFMRRQIDLGLACDTRPEKVEEAVAIIRAILAEPEIAEPLDHDANRPRVGFDAFNADSLNIKVLYWYGLRAEEPLRDGWTFLEHGQRVNLRILRAFADAGIELASPTRMVALSTDPRRALDVRVTHPGGSSA